MIPMVLTCHAADHEAGLAGFAAAELGRAGLNVRLDPRPMDLAARFWPPIKSMISSRMRAEAWAFLLTDTVGADAASLETLAYAAAGAKGTRGQGFPVIALRPGSAATAMPSALSAMQPLAMSDQAWTRAVRSLSEGRGPLRGARSGETPGEAYAIALHHRQPGGSLVAVGLEFRPLTSTWSQFFVAVPWPEAQRGPLGLVHGVRGALPDPPGDAQPLQPEREGEWAVLQGGAATNRRESYFLRCAAVPSTVRFGVPGGHLQYTVRLRPV